MVYSVVLQQYRQIQQEPIILRLERQTLMALQTQSHIHSTSVHQRYHYPQQQHQQERLVRLIAKRLQIGRAHV